MSDSTIVQKNVTIKTCFHDDGQLSSRQFWVDNKRLSEQEVEKLLKSKTPSCHGKSVVIDGKTYRLVEEN